MQFNMNDNLNLCERDHGPSVLVCKSRRTSWELEKPSVNNSVDDIQSCGSEIPLAPTLICVPVPFGSALFQIIRLCLCVVA